MNYKRFEETVNRLKQDYCLEIFSQKRETIQIKKEKTIAKNLEHIFATAIDISNRKGFHAMSMRDLSKETGMSIGALYNYFSGKAELLQMMQLQRRTLTRRLLASAVAAENTPVDRLRSAVKTHLYLSEAMQPWFYFSYMEAKNLDPDERRAAVQGELKTEQVFIDILESGVADGVFVTADCRMAAGLIKAMLQDWYLKHPKHSRRKIDVDEYYRFLMTFLEKSLFTERANATERPA